VKESDRSEIRNAFEFVTVSGARARQLLAGCTPRTEGSLRAAKLAQKEVKEGKVRKLETEAAVE
jgi:DNA-directed RNA polymerase subunit K/omega